MYPSIEAESGMEDVPTRRPWDTWGRPPGGFLDLGCVSHISVAGLV